MQIIVFLVAAMCVAGGVALLLGVDPDEITYPLIAGGIILAGIAAIGRFA